MAYLQQLVMAFNEPNNCQQLATHSIINNYILN